jgi:hypothetical protein
MLVFGVAVLVAAVFFVLPPVLVVRALRKGAPKPVRVDSPKPKYVPVSPPPGFAQGFAQFGGGKSLL